MQLLDEVMALIKELETGQAKYDEVGPISEV